MFLLTRRLILHTFFVSLVSLALLRGCVSAQKIEGKIIFRSNIEQTYDLYVMEMDGSNLQLLAKFPDRLSRPSDNNGFFPSPDGKKVAYISDKNGDFEIYVIDIENGDSSNLTNHPANDISLAWSPDGSEIAFVSDRNSVLIDAKQNLWTNNVYVMNSDGSDARRITVENDNAQYGSLSWSPNGENLAIAMSVFSPFGPFVSGIYCFNVNTLNVKKLTAPSDLIYGNPKWSPSGKQIMYFEMGSKQSTIHVMDSDGTNQIALTDKSLGVVISAFWSPSGDRILFSSTKNENFHIYSINPDGTNLITLPRERSDYDTSPYWSPNGDFIVFSSNRDKSGFNLYIMNSDGTNLKRLTSGLDEKVSPIWILLP